MKNYALFLGCTIPARQPNYELSARKTKKVSTKTKFHKE